MSFATSLIRFSLPIKASNLVHFAFAFCDSSSSPISSSSSSTSSLPSSLRFILANRDSFFLLDEEVKKKINDSKKISAKQRSKILDLLKINIHEIKTNNIYSNDFFSFILIHKDADYIDKNNILKSTMDAFYESYLKIKNSSDVWIIDGNKKPKEVLNDENVLNIIKGDSKSLLIGIASIIAKEFRDYQMLLLDRKYPEYLFSNHKGYVTKKHYEAILENGLLEKIHRKTFLKKIIK